MGIAVDASRVEQAIRQIGCMALKMPFKYLGSVVGDRMSRVKAWNDVIDTLINKVRKSIGSLAGIKVIASKDGGEGQDLVRPVKPTFPLNGYNIIQEVADFKLKDIQVATKLSHVDLEWSFRRKSRGGAEQIQMTTLKEILEGCILSDSKDTWTWSLEGSGEFSVSSIRENYDSIFLVEIMSKISGWWDLGYQEINSYEEWTDWMLSIRLPYNLKKVFEGVCYIVWWFIWDWRNPSDFSVQVFP
ncbi:hypothetical protein Tco_0335244 [Tanacetum coccineum]